MGRAKVAWLAPLLGLLALLAPARGAAETDALEVAGAWCATRPTFSCVPYPGVSIPANGAMLIATLSGEPTEIQVTELATGTLIAGQLRKLSDQFWAWRADNPPPAGRYEVGINE